MFQVLKFGTITLNKLKTFTFFKSQSDITDSAIEFGCWCTLRVINDCV